MPDFILEKKFIDRKYVVLGVDEVGRGALAGPVVAAAVCLGSLNNWDSIGLNDSKKLSPKKRQELSKIIRREAAGWGIGEASASYIDRYGIVKATARAMRQAVRNCRQNHIFLLIDAFHIKYVPGVGLKNQMPIIKGDEKSLSIAAASIIAKVHRDNLMSKLHKKYPRYHWRDNKGYGTADHIKALKTSGTCRLHRRCFMLKLRLWEKDKS